MSQQASTKPPAGTRDFLPGDIYRREYAIGVIRRVYERYGFEPLETPAVENVETLLGKYGEEGNKLIFKILRRGEHEASGQADLALRYDLTVPLARVVAQYQNELPKFFKRYQIQPVWRADRPARGRFREFYQCDIDAIGSTSAVVEAELLAAVSEAMIALGFDDFVIRLNHRRLLSALLDRAGVAAALQPQVLVAVDKLDKIGVDGVSEDLRGRGVDEAGAAALLTIFGSFAADRPHADALASLEAFVGNHEAGRTSIAQLQELVTLADTTPAAGRIRLDPSLARGLSYYTGAIMEITAENSPGSLAAGGRYDNLIGMFLGRDVPACGFSLGLERIIVLMTERNMFPETVARGAADVMVTVWNEESRVDALSLATEIRATGLRVEVYPEPGKVGRQFKYASSRNVPFVTIVGDDERARGDVSVKDLRSGEQETVPRGELPGFIRARVDSR